MKNTPKHTNRLIDETSPYLLQHAHNPVDWYPWGEEALNLAKELDKPILLSIGYSACHWCHVMERESFENEEIAAIMNKHYINIKVDREERPDLDEIYMSAVQIMTGSGGWPMTVFLTPDRKPFYGGTYFPPDDRYGRPGFPKLLVAVKDAYQNKRADIDEQAEKLVSHINQISNPKSVDDLLLDDKIIEQAFYHYQNRFDSQHGGFGQAPKFPPGMGLILLLRYWKRSGNSRALHIVEFTLEKMARGGMYDQLGGGFHRYSTDEIWLVPHFEKMLYDNSLLTVAYLEAFQATSKPFYREVVEETLDYVLREMYNQQNGGFYSTQDADSEGVEGKFFVWTPGEVEQILGQADAKIFCDFYDVTDHGNFEHQNILWVKTPADLYAKKIKIDQANLVNILNRCKKKLFEIRDKRIKPGLDDKILTSWNGLMIRSMGLAYQILGDLRYLEAAEKSAKFILTELVRKNGHLLRTHRAGKSHLNACLEDYSYFIAGLIELYQASFDPYWLREADRLNQIMISQFWDPQNGGFFFTGKDYPELIVRSKSAYDGATPSGASMAIHVLLRLAILLNQPDLIEKAKTTFSLYDHAMKTAPSGSAQMLCGVDFLIDTPKEIAIIGNPLSEQTQEILKDIHRRFVPNKVVALLNPNTEDRQKIEELIPLLASKTSIDGKTTIYVCQNYACQLPTTDVGDLDKLL
ncbi:TPA: thioredoxin domain-containing protein [Candidatus Poribacteria bacterium]|nr:thioredoxin domain-containing protein [Candidatus Poribacteria bacterium]HIB90218.1 thioredoxin domain-containing protein [Candidatus Poribacteria bacterium]HIN28496.1 thioredoxin domain-containing protein [Candidatus Poribacteria bacterium]